jgi:adenylate cyclase class 2
LRRSGLIGFTKKDKTGPTMKEIEIKVLEIDRKAVETRLVSLGAKKVFDGEIHALYYDFTNASLKESGCALRLRLEGTKSVLCLKKLVESKEAKIREEHELEVSDFNTMKFLLEGLGLKAWLEMKKHRTSYEFRGAHFEIDEYHGTYDYIPLFLEIEGPDIETIHACAELLGFTLNDCKPWDILEVAAYYSGQSQDQ